MRIKLSYSEAGRMGYEKSKRKLMEMYNNRIEQYNKSPKSCLYCQTVFLYKHRHLKFCNKSCSTKHINSNKRIVKYCLFCNKILTRSHTNQRCCSHTCDSNYKRQIIFNNIENGSAMYREKWYKNYLIYKYGCCCMLCGWNKINVKSNKCPIQLHHIDGNSQNNNLINLQLLCPNCHSLTPTFGALNMGNGRHYRRERYKEGKSS